MKKHGVALAILISLICVLMGYWKVALQPKTNVPEKTAMTTQEDVSIKYTTSESSAMMSSTPAVSTEDSSGTRNSATNQTSSVTPTIATASTNPATAGNSAPRTTRAYPETVSAEIQKNKDFIKKHLPFSDFSSEIIAKKLYTVGVTEIRSIQIVVQEAAEARLAEFEIGGFAAFLIKDSTGQKYYLTTDAYGHYLEVQLDNAQGEYIYQPVYPANPDWLITMPSTTD